jgi:hypothetical protein
MNRTMAFLGICICILVIALSREPSTAQGTVNVMDVLQAPPSCKAYYRQAQLARQQGKLDDCERYLVACLQDVQKSKSLAAQNKDLLLKKLMTELMWLSANYAMQKKYSHCESITKFVVSAEEARSGPNSPELLGWLNALQDAYKKEGKSKEAAEINARIAKIQSSSK